MPEPRGCIRKLPRETRLAWPILIDSVPVRGPCELAVGQIGDVGPRREAEVAGLGQDRRVHVAHQIRISRSSPTGVPEELREPSPGVDLDQDFRQLSTLGRRSATRSFS